MSESQWQEVKSSTVQFGKVSDYVEGTLIDIRVREVQDDKKGRIRKNIYEIKADAGQYHETDEKKNPVEPPVKCELGESYLIWGGKEMIDDGFKKVKLGQKVKVQFTQEDEPKKKGYSGFKHIRVFRGVMDEVWLAEQEASAAGDMKVEF